MCNVSHVLPIPKHYVRTQMQMTQSERWLTRRENTTNFKWEVPGFFSEEGDLGLEVTGVPWDSWNM